MANRAKKGMMVRCDIGWNESTISERFMRRKCFGFNNCSEKRLNTDPSRVSNGASMKLLARILYLFSVSVFCVASTAIADHHEQIKHSYLTMGGKTAIISEEGKVVWSYRGGSRDGFVLPNGNILIAFAKSVEEVTRDALWRVQLPQDQAVTMH